MLSCCYWSKYISVNPACVATPSGGAGLWGEHAYLCTVILTWGGIKLAFVFEQIYGASIHLSEPQS